MMFAVRAAEQGRNGGEDEDDDEEARAAGCELVGCGRWAAGCGLWGCGMAVAWRKIKKGSMDDAWKDGIWMMGEGLESGFGSGSIR
jgi:hypothetical protein